MQFSPLQLRSDHRVFLSLPDSTSRGKENIKLTTPFVSKWFLLLLDASPVEQKLWLSPCQWDPLLSLSAQAWAMTLLCGLCPPILGAEPMSLQLSHTGPESLIHHCHHCLPLLLLKIHEGDPPTFTGLLMPPSPKWLSYSLAQSGGKVCLVDSLLFFRLVKLGHLQHSIFFIFP